MPVGYCRLTGLCIPTVSSHVTEICMLMFVILRQIILCFNFLLYFYILYLVVSNFGISLRSHYVFRTVNYFFQYDFHKSAALSLSFVSTLLLFVSYCFPVYYVFQILDSYRLHYLLVSIWPYRRGDGRVSYSIVQ